MFGSVRRRFPLGWHINMASTLYDQAAERGFHVLVEVFWSGLASGGGGASKARVGPFACQVKEIKRILPRLETV